MTTAQIGSNVSVTYVGKLSDGSIFDSTDEKEPFTFTIGEGEVIPGFEDGIIGMSAGEKKIINIPVEEAYGPHSEDLIFNIAKDEVQTDGDLQVGDMLEMPLKDGNSLYANIVEVTEEELIIDANHELAGEDLTFEIELLSID
ncbi:MAG: FKBP-type peptidyl-prolyl cis-trans isomerase [Candidatus Kapabacteria bacterium]|nr:FKBP-type peptidyl-prolyl cis-trans isomerase [Ignavibacteriota bacterium]MCW5886156.1 FKBP-type peptidyl-prolyl cis-trans isomerase [Candidatus Kapabacteria bacterium]